MKKKLGILLFAAALFGATSASAASVAGPNCYRAGNVWICEY
ncbi:hypothetical protein [Viridibacillus soli]|nr:hypothetical protein [Viridibacillus soli]